MKTKHWSSTFETDLDWIEEEFLSLNLGDKRLNKRLKKIISAMSKRTDSSLPDIFGNWAGTKAAYRFFSRITSYSIHYTKLYDDDADILRQKYSRSKSFDYVRTF
nr:transposase [Leptospira inadai]